MLGHTNAERRDRGYEALQMYRVDNSIHDAEPDQAVLMDLLCDVLHLCATRHRGDATRGMSMEILANRWVDLAMGHVSEELYEERAQGEPGTIVHDPSLDAPVEGEDGPEAVPMTLEEARSIVGDYFLGRDVSNRRVHLAMTMVRLAGPESPGTAPNVEPPPC